MPLTLASLTLVAPASATAARAVFRPCVPTSLTVTVCVFPPVSTRSTSPTAMPVVAATLMFVSPAAAGAKSVVARDCVPIEETTAVSSSILRRPPTTKLLTLVSLRFVSPDAAGADKVALPYDHMNSRVSLYAERSDTVAAVPTGVTARTSKNGRPPTSRP